MRGPYRPILPVVWALGGVILLVVLPFGIDAALAVLLVTHLFFAGLVRADIKALRRQGLEWGYTRHLWFGAAFGLPFAAPAYYLYSGRRIRAENERRDAAERGDGSDRTSESVA